MITTHLASHPLAAAAATTAAKAPAGTLIAGALIAIAVIILLITLLKLNPFISLLIGSVVLAAIAGTKPADLLTSFTSGFGSTLGGIAPLIALGAIIGTVLVESGGAHQLVDRILAISTPKMLPWAVALMAFIIGIPLFFEIGIVLLVPIIMLIAKRAKVPVLLVGFPMLASLGELHALIPPHPGPTALVQVLHANIGLTLVFGLILAIPLVAIVGPLMAPIWVRLAPVYAPADSGPETVTEVVSNSKNTRRPKLGWTLTTMLLPVVLMLVKTVGDLTLPSGSGVLGVIDFIGAPLTALVVAALLAIGALGLGTGRSLSQMSTMVASSFGPVAGLLLIVGGGGGFKQTLVDLGVGDVVAHGALALNLSPLLVAWVLAAVIRIATGSSTVAALTAAGLALPLTTGLDPVHVTFMVLALGLGSGFLSHVNDAGFWLIKEFFGLTVWQTFKTWSVMSMLGPILGLGGISLLWAVIA